MRYEISEEAHKMLEPLGFETVVLFKIYLNKYFQTGKNPQFDSIELRDIWFRVKMHELANMIQYEGYNSFGTFCYVELRDYLNKNAAKFANPNFHLEQGE